jgi:DNA-binding CsgD family transcriptional regulator/PAS domain-containing protein
VSETSDALETIDLLYQAAMEPELWPQALQKLAEAVGGVSTAMIPITPQNTAGLIASPALQEPNVEYEREWWQHDTRVQRIHSRKLDGGVCCEAELFTDEEVARDPLRQEFLRRYRIGAFAAQLVPALPDVVVAFSVQRLLERGQFERHELKTLELLGKHAARAAVVGARLAAVSRIERTLFNALAQFQCGALVVDCQGTVIFCNEPANRLIGDGLTMLNGRLRPSSREDQAVFAHLMKSALRPSARADHLEPIALSRPSGRRPLLMQAIPVSSIETDWSVPDSAAALVIIIDPEQDGPQAPEQALRLLGLTRSEARLAALIGAGRSRAEAADALGVSEATASDTIKRVYAKLDLSRQSELVRLVDRLAMLQPRRDGDRG